MGELLRVRATAVTLSATAELLLNGEPGLAHLLAERPTPAHRLGYISANRIAEQQLDRNFQQKNAMGS